MLAVLIAGGMLGKVIIPARIQRDAVAAIQRGGGYVRYDWEGKDFRAVPVPPRDRLGLRSLLGTDYFDVPILAVAGPNNVDDRALANLAKLEGLKTLAISLGGPPLLSPTGMSEICKFRSLPSLSFGGGDAKGFLPYLEGVRDLRSLGWNCPGTTEADLASIARLGQLEELSLEGKTLTEAGLMQLTRLQKLESLSIRGPMPLIDWEARGRFLRAMPNLRYFAFDDRCIVNKPRLKK